MNTLGEAAILMALLLSIYAIVMALAGGRRGRQDFLASANRAVLSVWALLTLASIALLYALVTRDFSLAYVAGYSSRALPLAYTLSVFWAGQAGSLLFWAWLLATFAGISVLLYWRHHPDLMPYVIGVMMANSVFFTLLLVTVSNPFDALPFRPPDGRGLNPLLQNPGMFFHPPTQYLGFVGVTVPYAFAIAALVTRRLDDAWIRATRRWTLFGWFFLTAGMMFGMQWAYVTLGWGGYWAWDPVENASLMPWLTATAFLHSVMIQEKRDMLKVWNLVLIILTFVFSLFGTFLTRSGVLSSIHSFVQGPLGPMFLGFIGMVLIFSFLVLFSRLGDLRSRHELDSLISRESSFLFNNLFLVAATFAVFLGTIFPVLSEAVRGVKIAVGPPYFNQVIAPIGLGLLLLMGICPLISWRRASPENLARNFLAPAAWSLALVLLLVALGVRPWAAVAAFGLCAFVVATIALEVHRSARVRRQQGGITYLGAVAQLVARHHRRYGGYVIHLGVVMVVIAMIGMAAFMLQAEASLRPGETLTVGRYTLRFERVAQRLLPDGGELAGILSVSAGRRQLGTLAPRRILHGEEEAPHTQVAIRSTPVEDLYVMLASVTPEGIATFKVQVNPLMVWMWAGFGVLAIGTLVCMWPERRRLLPSDRAAAA